MLGLLWLLWWLFVLILFIESKEVMVCDGVVLVFDLGFCSGDIDIALSKIYFTHMYYSVVMYSVCM